MTHQNSESVLFSTLKINPDEYSYRTSKNQFESMQFALAGLLFLFRRQHSFRLLIVVTTSSLILALVAGVRLPAIMLMMVAISTVWVTEIFNTALEAVINMVSSEYHPMAQVGKDVAAAASLVTTFMSGTITLLTIVPPLWATLR